MKSSITTGAILTTLVYVAAKFFWGSKRLFVTQTVCIHPKFWDDKYGMVQWSNFSREEKKARQEEMYKKIDKALSKGHRLFTGSIVDYTTGKSVPYITVETVKS